MLDRVFHERQQHHRRYLHASEIRRNVDLVREPAAHADAVNTQIRVDQPGFLGERGLRRVATRERDRKVFDEVAEHGRGRLAVELRQPADVRERVEQEVRGHLRLKYTQARVAEPGVRIDAVDLDTEQRAGRREGAVTKFEHNPEQHDEEDELPTGERVDRDAGDERGQGRADARKYAGGRRHN